MWYYVNRREQILMSSTTAACKWGRVLFSDVKRPIGRRALNRAAFLYTSLMQLFPFAHTKRDTPYPTWPPISPIMTMPSVSGSLVNLSRQSMKLVPLNGSPPIPTQVLWPMPVGMEPVRGAGQQGSEKPSERWWSGYRGRVRAMQATQGPFQRQ